ncbi:MAG: sigma-70 family RNA polymerase sigma factor [Bacteroidetes bacterium]|nr:sigma-70 family RNA polymerase sigma factor [Bacteroidota bacterium]
MKQNIPEQELIDLIKRQRKEGYDLLYNLYANAIYTVICRSVTDTAVAEDLLQEVFVKIWRNIDKYDSDKGRLYTWLVRLTRNVCIDHLRSCEHRNAQATRENTDDIREMADKKDREIDYGMMAVIARMEPKYREVIDMVFYHNYSHIEAAEVLGLPLGTLKSRVRMALIMLKSSLQLTGHE